MVLPATTWNHRYTLVASLLSGLICVLAVVGGAMMVNMTHLTEDFDTELPRLFRFYTDLGLGGLAAVLLGFLAVVGAMFFCERQRVAISVVLIAGGVALIYFAGMLFSSLKILFSITWFIM